MAKTKKKADADLLLEFVSSENGFTLFIEPSAEMERHYLHCETALMLTSNYYRTVALFRCLKEI